MQRAPDKRPPALVSLVFTALALLPLVALFGYLFVVLGVNFNVSQLVLQCGDI